MYVFILVCLHICIRNFDLPPIIMTALLMLAISFCAFQRLLARVRRRPEFGLGAVESLRLSSTRGALWRSEVEEGRE